MSVNSLSWRVKLLRRRVLGDGFPIIPDAFPQASFALPFCEEGRAYYSTLQDPGHDHGFLLNDDDGVVAIVHCDNANPDLVTCFGFPIEIWCRLGLTQLQQQRVHREISGELANIAGRRGVLMRTSAALDPAGISVTRLMELGATPRPAIRSILNLEHQSDDDLLLAMAKSHRQKVRWGSENLQVIAVDRINPTRAAFDSYRLLHAEIAGRITRPMESWDAMFALIVAGAGDLLLVYYEGQLVGAALTLDSGVDAFYASAANRREHFDKPLSHFPIFLATQRSRARGKRRFDIGETFGGAINMNDEKERAIAGFKRGFGDVTDASLVWTIPSKGAR